MCIVIVAADESTVWKRWYFQSGSLLSSKIRSLKFSERVENVHRHSGSGWIYCVLQQIFFRQHLHKTDIE